MPQSQDSALEVSWQATCSPFSQVHSLEQESLLVIHGLADSSSPRKNAKAQHKRVWNTRLWSTTLPKLALKASSIQFRISRGARFGSSREQRIISWVKRPWIMLIVSIRALGRTLSTWNTIQPIIVSQRIIHRSRRQIHVDTLAPLTSTIVTLMELVTCLVTYFLLRKLIRCNRRCKPGRSTGLYRSSPSLNSSIQTPISLHPNWQTKVTFTSQMVAMAQLQRSTVVSIWLSTAAGKDKKHSVRNTSSKQAISIGQPQTISSCCSHKWDFQLLKQSTKNAGTLGVPSLCWQSRVCNQLLSRRWSIEFNQQPPLWIWINCNNKFNLSIEHAYGSNQI